MTGLGLIRIHIAALVSLALVGALLVSKLRIGAGFLARGRKFLTFFGAAAAVVLAVTLIPDIVGLELSDFEDLTPFTTEITRRTSEDGTVAAGNPVGSIVDVPGAVALVLFRPFLFEASELQHYLAAAETTLILLLFVWKLPAMIRNWREWRKQRLSGVLHALHPGLCRRFSVVRNLGIIARQRGQVLAFFLAVVIGLGWNEKQKVTRAADTGAVDAARTRAHRDGHRSVKRALDLLVSALALVLLSPVLLRDRRHWSGCRLGRPVLFKQERPGLARRAVHPDQVPDDA